MNVNVVTYKIEVKSDFTRYIINFILTTLGLAGKEVDSSDADIYYGNRIDQLSSQLAIKKNPADIIWEELINGTVTPDDIKEIIPFDIINAIGFFLNDEGNKDLPEDSYDDHARLLYEKSFQYRHNIANYPIVNLYVNFLRSLFENIFSFAGIPLWPDSRQCAIGLSHDADYPDKYAIVNAPLINPKTSFRHNLITALIKVNAKRKRLFDKNPENYWLFEEIMDAEEKLGLKSTFFFSAVNQFEERGSDYDVYYDIKKPKFIEIFRKIAKRGFEVGLHASYNAYLDANRFIYEKQKLTKMSGLDIKGLRHHFWHLGKNIEKALEMHEISGFEYDSSIAFEEEMGFKRNIALPYHPWVNSANRQIRTMQLPVFCMDGSLFYKPIEVEDAVEKLKHYITIVKKYGGVGVIDWHVRTSYPKSKEYLNWGKAYLKIIKYLAADKEIWTTNLGEISSWVKKREKMLSLSSSNCSV